jgi:hypothetical protein
MPPTDLLEQVLGALATTAEAFFATWLRVLGRIATAFVRLGRSAGRAAERWKLQWAALLGYLMHPDRAWAAADQQQIGLGAAFGVRALLAGLLASAALTLLGGGALPAALGPVLTESLWAAGRIAVCALLVPASALPRERLLAACLAGLAPYALGLTFGLRALALVLSAAATHRFLRAAGLAGPATRTAVAWAFGGQAAVVVFGIALRGGLAAILAG